MFGTQIFKIGDRVYRINPNTKHLEIYQKEYGKTGKWIVVFIGGNDRYLTLKKGLAVLEFSKQEYQKMLECIFARR